MSDFNFYTSIGRDEVVGALECNLEQAAYVLAEFAANIGQTRDMDELRDYLSDLSKHQKERLQQFCTQVADWLEPSP